MADRGRLCESIFPSDCLVACRHCTRAGPIILETDQPAAKSANLFHTGCAVKSARSARLTSTRSGLKKL